MVPRLVLYVTRDSVRVELIGKGVVREEAAAIVPRFHARSGMQIVAAGDVARRIEAEASDRIAAARVQNDAHMEARIVPLESAPWWREGVRPGLLKRFDPWEHDGECVVAWPFASESWAPALAAALLQYVRFAALRGVDAPRVGALARWWLTRVATAEVHLCRPPADGERDALLRELAPLKMRLASAPASRPRPLSRLSWLQWTCAGLVLIGGPAVGLIATHSSRPNPPLRYVLGLLGASIAAALGLVLNFRSEGAAGGLSRERLDRKSAAFRALRRFQTADPPEPGRNERLFRLGAQDAAQIVAVGGAFGLMSLGPRIVGLLGRNCCSGTPVVATLVSMLVLLVAGGALGDLLVGARLTVGERGITVRRTGFASRPLFIPNAQIRSAVASRRAGRRAELSILLRDGDEVHLAVTSLLSPFRDDNIALGAEEAILAAIKRSRPYREPAARS